MPRVSLVATLFISHAKSQLLIFGDYWFLLFLSIEERVEVEMEGLVCGEVLVLLGI